MSLLIRVTSPPSTRDLLSKVSPAPAGGAGGQAPDEELKQALKEVPHDTARLLRPLLPWPTGLGTATARPKPPSETPSPQGREKRKDPVSGPTGLGTAGSKVGNQPKNEAAVPALHCPEAVRDDHALGEEVNRRLVAWAEEVGIYPGKLDQVKEANVGRLIMLAHPDSDDPDRLLAAAKCALAEWATDDHYVDDEELGADPRLLARRLVLANAVVDPAQLPVRYMPDLEEAVQQDPVLVAYRSSLGNLARHGTATQLSRLRHELAVMFVAYNQEAVWRTQEELPPVWEYIVHRHENSFLPCMVLIDLVGGYEISPREFVSRAVRRVFTMAGVASVLVNDLYSMEKERDSTLDFNLPKLLAAEEKCSLEEAARRTAEIHDELVRTVEIESALLGLDGSLELKRFLAGILAWLGGNREWHRTSLRYNGGGAGLEKARPAEAGDSDSK